ncbi:MAG: hypothetical protein CMJ35_09725 [Phycisphaerae bacterium]|nr:hypothetical protein [Phycisphaerae bacterium]MBM91873.1 hypothetical protein [Phycisphaerae bacterium]HCT46224.1 hypothetical protein [Phycisphaerales bacterium]|tara:strand:+ start:733 stop:1230 length:498 start_codon:yes stop_codon:yes gene_type:complete
MSKVITATFESSHNAAGALESLVSKGFDSGDISLIASEEFDRENFGVETHSKLAEGAAIGAGVGGAAVALVAGLTTVGAVATGGVGIVAAGPLVAALAGAGAGAAGGSVLGGLVGAAIPEHEIKHYEDAIEKGHVLVGVNCNDSDRCDAARDIFEQFNASKVSHA